MKDQGNIRVISLEGGSAPNVVTPKCRLVAEGSLRVRAGEGITVTTADGRTVAEAVGLGAHGSTPALGINAAVRLLHAVEENDFGGDFQRMMDFILNKIDEDTTGKKLGVYYEDEETGETTVNLGIINYDGDSMRFTLDIRHPKTAVPESVKAAVYQSVEAYGLSIDKFWQQEILYVPKDSELIQKLMQVYEMETGCREKPLAIGGGTYAKAFKNMVAFGPVFPGTPEVIHQPNESADISELMKSFQTAAAAMYELACQ